MVENVDSNVPVLAEARPKRAARSTRSTRIIVDAEGPEDD